MLSSYRKEEYSIIFEDMDIAIINELIEWYTKSTNPNSMKLIFYNCCIFELQRRRDIRIDKIFYNETSLEM
jgi:hypothetical protein